MKFLRVFSVFLCALCGFKNSIAQTTEILLDTNWTYSNIWEFEVTTTEKAYVPGCIHTDLVRNHRIEDPFYGTNEKEFEWVGKKGWPYKCLFYVSEEFLKNDNQEIRFEGIDTHAFILLNGKNILTANNMFREWNVNVKGILKAGRNLIEVDFLPPTYVAHEYASTLPTPLPGGERIFSRKAQYQFGWDWGPRFVTCGIWKPVKLVGWNNLIVRSVNFQTISIDTVTKTNATARVHLSIEATREQDITIEVSRPNINHPDYSDQRHLNLGKNELDVEVDLRDIELWYCRAMGKQQLYDFHISVYQGNKSFYDKTIKTGIRKIELNQENGAFQFILNGIPIFAKGANFIPMSSFPSSVTRKDYEKILKEADFANMNMLRVWGGGIYESDDFYSICDSLGILVWQDFMFACAIYPTDEEFINNVEAEVRYQAKRLVSHPCIALWCGNNEITEGWNNWGWQKEFNYSKEDSARIWDGQKKLFYEQIPSWLSTVDQQTTYWPSSPSFGWGRKESLTQGDCHYWGVWWGMEPFSMYREKVGRFMSEYGFQGMPSINSMKKYIPEAELNFDSPSMKQHQKHPKGAETINEYMKREWPVPKNLDDYAYVSQLVQAYGVKEAIESHIMAQPYCSGTLYWQLNDCWPVTSWSSVDYYGERKALHYFVEELYNDFNLISRIEDDSLLIFIQSPPGYHLDTLMITINNFYAGAKRPINVTVKKVFDGLSGNIWIGQTSFSENFYPIKRKEEQLVTIATLVNDTFPLNFQNCWDIDNLIHPKDLKLKNPKIEFSFFEFESDTYLRVFSHSYAKDVYFYTDTGDLILENNFIDLLPEYTRLLKITGGYSGDLLERIKVRSLNDVLRKNRK